MARFKQKRKFAEMIISLHQYKQRETSIQLTESFSSKKYDCVNCPEAAI